VTGRGAGAGNGGRGAAPRDPVPPARGETVREALRVALRDGPATARDLSAAVGLREKDVADHLAHLGRSLARRGERLVVEPAACLACGWVFRERTRLARPGACPSCRSTRIDPPVFRIEGGA
jgi:predicted Zn-ribbon and HTH transcriptional regulator